MTQANKDQVGASAPATASPASVGYAHDLRHQVNLVREALQSEKRRLGFFVGAGCPLGIYDAQGKKSLKHIPDVDGLTDAIATKLEGQRKEYWDKLVAACKSPEVLKPNVEHVLTQLRTISGLKGKVTVDGMTSSFLKELDTAICTLISKIVSNPLPNHLNSYNRFARWIGHVPRIHPVELFTSNYDLLVEESLEQASVPFFDGFVGAREPFFDLVAMEQDHLPQRWVRLWKLHGSVNWIRREDTSVYRNLQPGQDEQLLIYPSHLKYEQSRRMPYLAMIDRLRAFFRESNPLLVVCGYSFADEHLNEVFLDGLRGNRAAHCIALMFDSLDKYGTAMKHAYKNANLTLLARDGAVVGTRRAQYNPVEQSQVVAGIEAGPNSAVDPALCTLGDFHHFGLFLEQQYGV